MNTAGRKKFWGTILFLGFLMVVTACRQLAGPEFVNHPRPAASLEFSSFEAADCPKEGSRLRLCAPESPLAAAGCTYLEEPSYLLGNLEPSWPIITCVVVPSRGADRPGKAIEQMKEGGEYISWEGGLDPWFYRYAIYQDGEYEIVATEEAFRERYAPIDSPEEALGYALALTNFQAYYDLEYDPELEYFVDRLEDSHVEGVPGGFDVHLFYYQEFGCGPHPTSAVVIRVGQDGSLEQISVEEVFKDPTDDTLCVD